MAADVVVWPSLAMEPVNAVSRSASSVAQSDESMDAPETAGFHELLGALYVPDPFRAKATSNLYVQGNVFMLHIMTDQMWPLVAAVLAANILTAMFLYGMRRAFQIYTADEATWGDLACLLVPLSVIGGGVFLYW